MAIYHLEAKVISRGTGRSACAASAYMSCSAIYNDYDGIQHDYTRKQGLVWEHVFLPDCAPAEWQDREKLWNAVEEAEKTKDSRLAREFVAALPIELGKDEWVDLLSKFIREQFVDEGMCADVAIHDTDGHNPHAHIMLTVRPLNENGTWQHKTEKEYLCVKGGEERGFTAAEYKEAQKYGWEKQYPYKVGKKKEYLTPSAAEAHSLERVSKYPKSTKYGRQNPISERWNSEEQLVKWRAAWADEVNRCLEQKDLEARIDHRSFANQGKDEQPTIHEGVAARMMEKKGIVSDRCELNRQIRRDNALLRMLKAEIQKLTEAVKQSIPAIAEALENIWSRMVIMQYQMKYNVFQLAGIGDILKRDKPLVKQYKELSGQIRQKQAERKNLSAKKQKCSPLQIVTVTKLYQQIATLTEEIEELKSQRAQILAKLKCADDKDLQATDKRLTELETLKEKLTEQQEKLSGQAEKQAAQYYEIEESIPVEDWAAVRDERRALHPQKRLDTMEKLKSTYGKNYNRRLYDESERSTDAALPERELTANEKQSLRQRLREKEAEAREHQPRRKHSQEWER